MHFEWPPIPVISTLKKRLNRSLKVRMKLFQSRLLWHRQTQTILSSTIEK